MKKQLIILIILAVFAIYISKDNEYVEIPSTSIRMRVIANSNSTEDQAKKMIIKSIVEEKIYELITGAKSEEEVDEIINNQKETIDKAISEKIKKLNLGVEFSSNYGLNYFPEKEFKGLRYKAGNYKSLVVTLDEGKGDNWWCVMYPPLCLVDENKTDYEYHFLIKDTLDKYN